MSQAIEALAIAAMGITWLILEYRDRRDRRRLKP